MPRTSPPGGPVGAPVVRIIGGICGDHRQHGSDYQCKIAGEVQQTEQYKSQEGKTFIISYSSLFIQGQITI